MKFGENLLSSCPIQRFGALYDDFFFFFFEFALCNNCIILPGSISEKGMEISNCASIGILYDLIIHSRLE